MMSWLGGVGLAGALMLGGCKMPATSAPAESGQPQSSVARSTGGFAQRGDGYAQGNERRRDQRTGGARTAAPGQFDYYLLTLSWSPEFCYTHPDKAECASGLRFVVHGLWPENKDGSYPEQCSDAPGPANPSQYSDLYPDQGLLQHEWQTHGTCSGMGPDAYFAAMRRAYQAVRIPEPLADVSAPISLSPDQIVTAFVQANGGTAAADYSVGCGNNFLSQVQICEDKNLHAIACQGLHSCGAMSVKVTPPGAARASRGQGDGSERQSGDGYSEGRSRHRHRSRDGGY